jgi:hypothetical protein
MPNYRFREWILSLVTTREHAATIVGDMVEEGRGTFRCWTAIASHFIHALTPSMLGMALTGFFAQFLLFFVPAMIAFRFVLTPWFDEQHFRILHWCTVSAFVATQIVTGYWIGRWDRRRYLLPSLLVILLDCTVGALNVNAANINMAIWSIPLLAGTFLSPHHTAPTGIT